MSTYTGEQNIDNASLSRASKPARAAAPARNPDRAGAARDGLQPSSVVLISSDEPDYEDIYQSMRL